MAPIIRKTVTTDGAYTPRAPKSQAVIADRTVYVSGYLGIDRPGHLVPGGIGPETKLTLEFLKAILEASGSSLEKVVKVTVYLRDMDDFDAMNEEYKKFFTKNLPARACVAVSGLPLDGRVEIDAIALIGDVQIIS